MLLGNKNINSNNNESELLRAYIWETLFSLFTNQDAKWLLKLWECIILYIINHQIISH